MRLIGGRPARAGDAISEGQPEISAGRGLDIDCDVARRAFGRGRRAGGLQPLEARVDLVAGGARRAQLRDGLGQGRADIFPARRPILRLQAFFADLVRPRLPIEPGHRQFRGQRVDPHLRRRTFGAQAVDLGLPGAFARGRRRLADIDRAEDQPGLAFPAIRRSRDRARPAVRGRPGGFRPPAGRSGDAGDERGVGIKQ